MNRRQLLLGATAAVIAPVLPPEVYTSTVEHYGDNPAMTGSWTFASPEEILQDIVRVMKNYEDFEPSRLYGLLPLSGPRD